MFKGFYTVATGMVAQQRKTDIITNNMANANTPGYKSDQSTIRSFPDMLMSAVNLNQNASDDNKSMKKVGTLNTGVYLQETIADYTQGSITSTGLTTDVALTNGTFPVDAASGNVGTVLFRLQGENGSEAYTRNGNFTLDGNGNLVNGNGLFVLDANGQRIQLQDPQFQISDDGTIVDSTGNTVARLGVSFAANPDYLSKRDNGLFYTMDGTALPSAYNVEGVTFGLQQGYLEASNVDASRAMTDLLTAYRAFEANQKVLQAYDKSMDKAVNEIGRVQ